MVGWLFGCVLRPIDTGHLETAPSFTVPCEGHNARFLHCSHRKSNLGPSHGSTAVPS